MKRNRFYFTTIVFLVILLGYLLFKIINPFFIPIMWAGIITIIFFPIYKIILRYTKSTYISASLTIIAVIAFIVGPFAYFGILLSIELGQLSRLLTEERLMALKEITAHPKIAGILKFLNEHFGITEEQLFSEVLTNVKILTKNLLNTITSSLTNILGFLVNFILMIFALFFFLIGGPGYLNKFLHYLPFSEYEKKRLTYLTKDIIISTIYGGVVVAILQALIGGLAFWILGIPTPVIWGSAIAIASFIPLLGAFSVWGPAAIYLFLTGESLKGVILIVIGAIGISTIDNLLKPIIIGSRIKMPTVVLFFSVLGGIKAFGPIGLIGGPLIFALFVAMVEIFRKVEDVDT